MGMAGAHDANKLADEFYGCPEYVIDCHQTEQTSVGVRIYHWRMLGSVLVPQFTAVIAPHILAAVSKDVHQAALKALQATPIGLAMWDGLALRH